MEQPAETRTPSDRSLSPGWESACSPASPGFANLLASLAERAKEPASAWNEDGLEDDVATLSYERALRTHARYGSTEPTDQSLTQAVDRGPVRQKEASPAGSAADPRVSARPAECLEVLASPDPRPNRLQGAPTGNLKDASITIRMSKAECAQLHRRAAEAGLTVSAYLRSCTFEAESLRAMVKDTLAQLRSGTTPDKPANPAPPRRARFGRLMNILTPRRGSPRVAQA